MNFTPVDEKEYAFRNVWPAAKYPCHIVKCEEGNSKKSGDPFLKCEAHIFNENGAYKTVIAYVMAAGKAAWQLRSLVEAVGALEKYKAGGIEAFDIEGKNCYARVGIEEDENGQYEPKNVIREFTAKPPKAAVKATVSDAPPPGHPAAASIEDSEIPF